MMLMTPMTPRAAMISWFWSSGEIAIPKAASIAMIPRHVDS